MRNILLDQMKNLQLRKVARLEYPEIPFLPYIPAGEYGRGDKRWIQSACQGVPPSFRGGRVLSVVGENRAVSPVGNQHPNGSREGASQDHMEKGVPSS